MLLSFVFFVFVGGVACRASFGLVCLLHAVDYSCSLCGACCLLVVPC